MGGDAYYYKIPWGSLYNPSGLSLATSFNCGKKRSVINYLEGSLNGDIS